MHVETSSLRPVMCCGGWEGDEDIFNSKIGIGMGSIETGNHSTRC